MVARELRESGRWAGDEEPGRAAHRMLMLGRPQSVGLAEGDGAGGQAVGRGEGEGAVSVGGGLGEGGQREAEGGSRWSAASYTMEARGITGRGCGRLGGQRRRQQQQRQQQRGRGRATAAAVVEAHTRRCLLERPWVRFSSTAARTHAGSHAASQHAESQVPWPPAGLAALHQWPQPAAHSAGHQRRPCTSVHQRRARPWRRPRGRLDGCQFA